MGSAARVVLAIVLLLALLVAPVITASGGQTERTVSMSYGTVTLLVLGSNIGNTDSFLARALKWVGNVLEDVDAYMDMETSTLTEVGVGIASFLVVLFMAVFLLPAVGSLLAFFTRWGFVLTIVGMSVLVGYVMSEVPLPPGAQLNPVGIGAIYLTSLLGLAVGGPGDSKKSGA
ncbi:hypothetical protein E3E36_00565 [Thermococcus sp. M36]|uniref:hypothetical protein n=1 Tax=Thermococcus sp. M36 TaxID=1638261 RepID=UPI00143A8BF2|nr:hypothetical protein [Thermococcus sp. M36]NJE04666.1 hypothetical protein [Thermococcus sp. M36]